MSYALPDLFVGITTWNSELFLQHCLRSIRNTTDGLSVRIATLDNQSKDRSVEIALDFGADVLVERCSQAIALNRLLSKSTARYTLLIHSDVVLLSPTWFATCKRHLVEDGAALVSPEDIGCGPMTRPYGAGMPESCFLFFDTKRARKARTFAWTRRRGLPWPKLHLDLEHYYVTHNLPGALARRGYSWKAMKVHASPKEKTPLYVPPFTPEYWSEELSYLRYAMGNFYSLDDDITHYHNWFDRLPRSLQDTSFETTEGEGRGLPLAFLSAGTQRFLKYLEAGAVVMPSLSEPTRDPKVTQRQEPDLTRPFAGRQRRDGI